jgi:16S rRNA (guanine527-N7)-methyltransferase
MLIPTELLKRGCADLEIELDSTAIERFDAYAALLTEWNGKFNLTAITEPSEIVVKHFVDSLTFFSAAAPAEGASLIDIGSGAGFPGIPIKILRGDMNVTLLDSTKKRTLFLQETAKQLGLEIFAVHGRAEDLAQQADFREAFDFAAARAVAPMPLLAEYCLGFVRIGGEFIAMKGPSAEDDLGAAKRAISLMGGEIGKIDKKSLSDGSSRTLISIKKISQTPTDYPRCSAKIAKKPL